MIEASTIRLPDTQLGCDRNFELSFTHHGDVRLSFWQGDPEFDAADAAWAHGYQLRHGSEVSLLAAMIGYRTRLGFAEDELQASFVDVASEVLSYPIQRFDQLEATNTLSIAQGQPVPICDRPDLDWECLVMPISSTPSHHDEGTGLFTTKAGGDTLQLVIASCMEFHGDPNLSDVEANSATYLGPEDTLPIARVLCAMSMGDYRKDMRLLLEERFSAGMAD